jgi:hypothetical protein
MKLFHVKFLHTAGHSVEAVFGCGRLEYSYSISHFYRYLDTTSWRETVTDCRWRSPVFSLKLHIVRSMIRRFRVPIPQNWFRERERNLFVKTLTFVSTTHSVNLGFQLTRNRKSYLRHCLSSQFIGRRFINSIGYAVKWNDDCEWWIWKDVIWSGCCLVYCTGHEPRET